MNGFILGLLLAVVPQSHPDDPIVDCAHLELNHYGRGSTQLIIWNWHGRELHVSWWQTWCGGKFEPRKVHGKYHLWIEDYGEHYLIRALKVSETVTAHDPEVVDRMYLPIEMRKGL